MTQMSQLPPFTHNGITLYHADVATLYPQWERPNVIISDGAYGVSGFKGDPAEATGLADWYTPHVKAWSHYTSAGTTLWFWNTELGWATVHPILIAHGWDYVGCNIWDKGIQHIAGNSNLAVLKGFPVVTEVCVQYVRRADFTIDKRTLSLKEWLRHEWERTGLPFSKTNQASGVANAATRKYFTKDHLWYAPPPTLFAKLVKYANEHGREIGRPYFTADGRRTLMVEEYSRLFAKFRGQYGITNVWSHPPLHTSARVKVRGTTKYAHLNQKPLKLIRMLMEVSSDADDIIWEPFGGLCTVGVAAVLLKRRAYCAEHDATIFQLACTRLLTYDTPLLEPLATSALIQQHALLRQQRTSASHLNHSGAT